MWASYLCVLLLAASTSARIIPSSGSPSSSRITPADGRSKTDSDAGSPNWGHEYGGSPVDNYDDSVKFLLRQSLDIMGELKDELQRLSGKHWRYGGGSATRSRQLITAAATSCELEVGLALDDVAEALHVAVDGSLRDKSWHGRSGEQAGHPTAAAMCSLWHSLSAASEHLRSCWDDIRLHALPSMREGSLEEVMQLALEGVARAENAIRRGDRWAHASHVKDSVAHAEAGGNPTGTQPQIDQSDWPCGWGSSGSDGSNSGGNGGSNSRRNGRSSGGSSSRSSSSSSGSENGARQQVEAWLGEGFFERLKDMQTRMRVDGEEDGGQRAEDESVATGDTMEQGEWEEGGYEEEGERNEASDKDERGVDTMGRRLIYLSERSLEMGREGVRKIVRELAGGTVTQKPSGKRGTSSGTTTTTTATSTRATTARKPSTTITSGGKKATPSTSGSKAGSKGGVARGRGSGSPSKGSGSSRKSSNGSSSGGGSGSGSKSRSITSSASIKAASTVPASVQAIGNRVGDAMAKMYASMVPDVIVAQDGSGDYRTVQAAVDSKPSSSDTFVVYVRSGRYREQVTVPTKGLVLVGDGASRTIITEDFSVASDNITTFLTATFAALKGHFVALGVGFENTAGVDNHQAVAMLTKDRSAFFECTFEGHQDTLYAHSGLQYYKDCTIGGTVDFVFGRATAVFDSPIIRVHKSTWFTVIAASSSPTPGLIFRDGTIVVDAGVNVPVYLGRPWRNAAFTLYINCVIPKEISSTRWLEWDTNTAANNSFIYYAEINSQGPGSAGRGPRPAWVHPGRLPITRAPGYTAQALLGWSSSGFMEED